jgi:hypothetical protein
MTVFIHSKYSEKNVPLVFEHQKKKRKSAAKPFMSYSERFFLEQSLRTAAAGTLRLRRRPQ